MININKTSLSFFNQKGTDFMDFLIFDFGWYNKTNNKFAAAFERLKFLIKYFPVYNYYLSI